MFSVYVTFTFIIPEMFKKAIKRLEEKQADPDNYIWIPSEAETSIPKRGPISNHSNVYIPPPVIPQTRAIQQEKDFDGLGGRGFVHGPLNQKATPVITRS